ncbi:MAG: nucleotide exchange factor GrpE [Opitutales bacterium]|nr:nucleotide exchange factor GrpE [Opitutales bacterium]
MKTEDKQKQDTQTTPEEVVDQPAPQDSEEPKAQDDATAETEAEVEATASKEAEGDETSDLFRQMDALQMELKTAKERYLRTVADLENFRKRAVREKDEARRGATSSLIEDLLPVIDNFQMGLAAAAKHDGGEAFTQGFEMILNQIQGVLRSNGVQELNPVGEAFNPNLHESIAYQPSDEQPEGHVISVERVGYVLHERLLRPAAVVVSKGSEQASEPSNS